MNSLIVVLLAIVSTALAGPMQWEKRDTKCDPATMVLDQRVWTCPHKNTVDTNGDCTQGVSETTNCTSYCEMSLSQGWGEFVVIPSSGCEQVGTCSYQQGMTYTTTESASINLDINFGAGTAEDKSKALTSAFNIGASYSWSQSLAFNSGWSSSIKLGENQCGTWVFIPYQMESCGTLTQVGTVAVLEQPGVNDWPSWTPPVPVHECDTNTVVKTVQNYCNKSLYKDKYGHSAGNTVFLYLDCSHGGLLRPESIPQDLIITGSPVGQPPEIFYPGTYTGSWA